MRVLSIVAAVTSVVLAMPVHAAELKVEPEAALPGIPATIRLIGTDVRSFEHGYIALHVRRGSEQFYASAAVRSPDYPSYFSSVERWNRPHPDELVLEPGPLLSGVGWFTDFELAKPGLYEFRLVYCPTEDVDLNSGRLDAPGITAVSAAAQFVVETPRGVDKEAWDFYKSSVGTPEEQSAAALMSKEASTLVWDRFPDSEYSRHIARIVGLGKSGAEGVKFFEDALKRPLDPEVRDVVDLTLATIIGDMGVEAVREGKDLKTAMQLVADSRIRIDRLISNTKSPKVRQLAETELLRIPTPAQLAARTQEAATTQ